ncbi:MAG: beta-ketoacyl-ACP reductase [Candidatus Hydrogenedentota bacterium]
MSVPVALVTGAGRGIGRGVALELARHGFDIVGCATKADPTNLESGLFEVKPLVESMGRSFHPVAGDISQRADHAAMIQSAIGRFGGIDVLVNNAGVAPLVRADILDTGEESYDRVMGINLRGPFFFTQAVAKQMIHQRLDGRPHANSIVFITSISSHTASPNRVEYCISKAGLSMAAQTFAVRLAEFGINVYDVRPGVTATDMTAAVQEKYDKLIAEGLLLQPRWGTPEDVGRACAALASGYFAYSTGSVIEVGGGFSVHRL